MRDTSIVGIGQTAVGEHWGVSLRDLATEAVQAALRDAGLGQPQMLFVGNMLSGQLSAQENVGALVADYAGLRGVEAIKVEAACASGAAALRMAYMAVAGGLCEVAMACGVEKMTEESSGETTTALVSAADAIYEGEQGLSFVGINALLMQRYMHEYGYRHADFASFAVTAHRNAVENANAMYPRAITAEQFEASPMISSPIRLFDSSGIGDGAAAVLVAPTALARRHGRNAVQILASAAATDSVALHDRRDPLVLDAARNSAQRALAQAGVDSADLDFFELHDAFSIMAALSLEAAGFAKAGEGVAFARDGAIALDGALPICTMGGLKARGHPVGATGLYQIVEAALQLRGQAGANQITNASLGMTQNIGGSGANVITHILETL